ncbi:MAG: ketol-acid reductoisomerase, partial [Bacteroidetes bacterium]
MAVINFGGVEETVITRDEFTLDHARDVLREETLAALGYGVQGPAQALNLRDNGFNVIVGQRQGSPSWDKAVADGWIPGETLFDLEEACAKGTILMNLLSDAGQIATWPTIKKHLTPGKSLYFSHGFGLTYNDQTGIVPPAEVDVFLAAPKGSGTSVRRLFLAGQGINSSFAVAQDYTGKARDKAIAVGIGIGSGFLFETTFQKEVFSDLTGERGVLMGALAGIMEAQYNLLREKGHTPSEA